MSLLTANKLKLTNNANITVISTILATATNGSLRPLLARGR